MSEIVEFLSGGNHEKRSKFRVFTRTISNFSRTAFIYLSLFSLIYFSGERVFFLDHCGNFWRSLFIAQWARKLVFV